MQCLVRTEELVRKVADIHDNRVQANLGGVAGMCLLDLPADQSFTSDEFVAQQVVLLCCPGLHKQPSWLRHCVALLLRYMALVSEPARRCLLVLQVRHVKHQAAVLEIRNQEVQRACEELLDLVASWPRENSDVRLPEAACNAYREYCSRSMYQVGRCCCNRCVPFR